MVVNRACETQMNPTYSQRFQDAAAVADYEGKEYAADSYSSQVWAWQRPVLEKIVREFAATRTTPVRLLDFACGTGRVISALEPLVAEAHGVDISPNMVALARPKCRRAELRVGDILAEPALLTGPYDVITAFRFLLNVEPALRRRALRRLREVLCEPDGRLLVNVHGNSHSLRHPAILWRRRRERAHPTGVMLNEMSPAESRALLRDSGFQIVQELGFGMLPPTLYRTPLRRLAAAVDGRLNGDHFAHSGAIDLLFVCRPSER